MTVRMQVDPKKIFVAFFIFVATILFVGYFHFDREAQRINHTIDENLHRAVESAGLIVGDAFHERIASRPPTALEDAATIERLTALARTQKVAYLYTLILDPQGNLRYSSSSARTHEPTGGKNLTRFYDPYTENTHLIDALQSGKSVWDKQEKPNERGNFRSFYLPVITPQGQRYIIGADIEVGAIQQLSNAAAFKSIALSLVIFLGALPFLLLYRNALRGSADVWREKAAATTDQLHKVTEVLETKVEEKTKELIDQSFKDPITGLPNRHHFQYDMDRHTYRALMIINIRHFREINDFFGSEIGDSLLRQMGEWLKSLHLNPYRLSGDEFAVLIEETQSPDELKKLCQRLLHRLSEHPFIVVEETISMDVAIGIDAQTNPSLSRADLALHQAKENITPIAFYTPQEEMVLPYHSNLHLITTIHHHMDAGRIICFYQPIVSLGSGRIEKYETLARMIDQGAEIVPPVDFLHIAKKTRLYPLLTRTIITQACEAFRDRNEEFSLNLSIDDILNPSTVRFIEECIINTDTAHRIVFEILENEGGKSFNALIHFIRRMKKLGAKIALDNYGIGYTSLENILKLDIDYLKIDGSLIRSIDTDPHSMIILDQIIHLADKAGLKTIAEAVESEAVYDQLKQKGLHYAQGFFTGKPSALSL
jgi:diguanylate cyclase (GGDEF)-like protein